MRDSGIGGLVALLYRQEWRDSDAGPSIASAVSAAMHDENPVVRMKAARGMRALHAAAIPALRATAIGELVVYEENPIVRALLVDQLGKEAASAPETVDGILERLSGAGDGAVAEPDGDFGRGVLHLISYLALIPRTPFASGTVERWCREAPAHAAVVEAFAQFARDDLAPPGSAGQQTAFRLLGTAADAALARFTRDPAEHAAVDLPEGQLAELHGAVKVAHQIAQQIYFASGAFDEKRGRERRRGVDMVGFANLAFPVLATCASLRFPQCVHQAVQTMIFLAPLDEARALQGIAAAVPADGPYAGDLLAGDAVIAYLERLLAEQRPLILFDENGVAAFRHLLATFAAAGNQAALALAYTFADVFR
jgi:hypothetical protein